MGEYKKKKNSTECTSYTTDKFLDIFSFIHHSATNPKRDDVIDSDTFIGIQRSEEKSKVFFWLPNREKGNGIWSLSANFG